MRKAAFETPLIGTLPLNPPRPSPARGRKLMRIDLDDPGLNAEVVASGVPSLPLMAPDLEGGVWLVTRDAVLRFNGNGEAAVTLDLGATGGD